MVLVQIESLFHRPGKIFSTSESDAENYSHVLVARNRVCCIPPSHRLRWWSCATSFQCTLWLLTPRCFFASAASRWNLFHSVTIMIFMMMIIANRRKRCISELWELLLILRTSFTFLEPLQFLVIPGTNYGHGSSLLSVCGGVFSFSSSHSPHCGRGFRWAAPEPKHAKHFGVMLIHTEGRIRIKRRRRSIIRGFCICLFVKRSEGRGRKRRV